MDDNTVTFTLSVISVFFWFTLFFFTYLHPQFPENDSRNLHLKKQYKVIFMVAVAFTIALLGWIYK